MINLRCAIVVPGRADVIEVEVTGPAGSTLRDVEDQLRASAQLPAGTPLRVDGNRLDPDAAWGRPPLLHGCLIVADDGDRQEDAPHQEPSAAGLLVVHVVGGPDSGRVHRLRPGDHVVGRAASAALQLRDDGVSRHHAVLHVGADGLRVTDLGSTNGTRVTGVRVGSEGMPLRPGERVRVGRSTLVVRSPATRPALSRLSGTGTVELHRPPRCLPREPEAVIRRPARPVTPTRSRSPWLGAVLPLLAAVPLAVLAHQPAFMLFALLGPVTLLGTVLSDRRGRHRDHREAMAAWTRADERAVSATAEAVRADLACRRRSVGDPPGLLDLVETPSARLWERGSGDPDVLRLSVGTGTVASTVTVVRGAEEEVQSLQDSPVIVSLVECGHLGLSGPAEPVTGLARWLLGQVVAWHGPGAVSVVVVPGIGRRPAWSWTRWLPHARQLTAHDVERLVSQRAAAVRNCGKGRQQAPGCGPRVVVVVDGAQPDPNQLTLTMRQGPPAGVHVLWLARPGEELPVGCGAVVDVAGNGLARLHAAGQEPIDRITVDAAPEAWAWRIARALAPLRDMAPEPEESGLPESVALLDLHEADLTDASAVARSWTEQGRTAAAPVGVTTEGVAMVDLQRDGPHALVGGTTGAGKSELLRTLVTSLAMRNRPDEMSFVLVDYKGGAAFAGCSDLPHVVGLVTDLDEHLADRALSSLQAELNRRERLLADVGACDLQDYQRHPRMAGRPPLPRLVVVIDEFRILAQELPSFLDGLVRVASVGRSLGVHLVLATQRPGGVVSADIKANVNLRIALRVRDRGDSEDVIGIADAAHLPQHVPGRALACTGGGPLTAFQVARTAASGTRHTPQRPRVRLLADDSGEAPGAEPTVPRLQEEDVLGAVARAAWDATRRLGVRVPASPWLPPLPERLAITDAVPYDGEEGPCLADRSFAPVVLGLLDLPEQQAQPPLLWHPVRDGHLGVVGGPGSGRTTTLARLALGAAAQWPPNRMQIHVVDAGGSLTGLGSMPHVGSLLRQDRPALVARLVSRLTEQLARRREQVPVGDGAASAGRATVVLLVDGWEAVLTALEEVDHGRAVDDLLTLVRDGASAGFRVVLAGGRDLLLGRVAPVLSDRLVLRTGDRTDVLLAGLSATAVPSYQPPGRAVRASDGAHAQIALPMSDGSLAEAIEVGADRARTRWGCDEAPDLVRLRPLPTEVRCSDLPPRRPGGGQETERWTAIGLGGDEATPCGLHLDVDPVAVISGPPGSGRSTALRTMASGLTATGATVVTISPRSSEGLEGPWLSCPPDAPEGLDRLLQEHPRACVLVDDVDALADGTVEPVLVDLARRRGPTALVLAGATSALMHGVRGAASIARTGRTGLVLQPGGPGDGEVLGVRVQIPDVRAPGRGVLVVRGSQQPVQVAR